MEAWLEASQFSASDCGSKIQWPRLRHPLNPGLQARSRYSFQVKTLDYVTLVTLVRLCGSWAVMARARLQTLGSCGHQALIKQPHGPHSYLKTMRVRRSPLNPPQQ
jgi:hypothetical protein